MNFFNHNLFQLSQSFSITTVFFNHHNIFQSSTIFFSHHTVITIFLNNHNLFQSSQSFSIITIFFNYHHLFQLSPSFSTITIFFNHHNLLESLQLWHYFYENEPVYKFHHLTCIFYGQNMRKIFCQYHMFLIYAFCFEFISFCV